ncbi:hypothetical protein MNBD_GAMMA16-683 [hydrothermal vent metagenome]|uniref:Uncharacterized protein n=1 Tax=hydrothermal vent metagenome TaxID=652676 RepID=A0A3B0ZQJ6_9ZZZZ
MLLRNIFLISLLLFFCSNTVYAIEYKCFVKTSNDDLHLVFIDTLDIQDARRAASAAKIELPQGGTVSITEIIECKEKRHLFNSFLGRALERKTPQ